MRDLVNEMGDGLQYLDIILLAMVAGFIALRLRSVLGRRGGFEQKRNIPDDSAAAKTGDVVAFPTPRKAEASSADWQYGPASEGLQKILAVDRTFDPRDFLSGARAAYEMIVDAFAKGDTATLRPMLSDAVFQHFANAIAERAPGNAPGAAPRIKSAELIEAGLTDQLAEITVKFISDMSDGKAQSDDIVDVWTFSRDVTSPDPNWTLTATAAIN